MTMRKREDEKEGGEGEEGRRGRREGRGRMRRNEPRKREDEEERDEEEGEVGWGRLAGKGGRFVYHHNLFRELGKRLCLELWRLLHLCVLDSLPGFQVLRHFSLVGCRPPPHHHPQPSRDLGHRIRGAAEVPKVSAVCSKQRVVGITLAY